MNWEKSWAILFLLIVMGTGGVWGMADNDPGKTVPAKPVVNQLSPQEQALFDAVKAGDSEKVKKLIADGVDVNCHSADGFSLLHVATALGDDKIVNLLLKNKANPSAWWVYPFSEVTGTRESSSLSRCISVFACTPLMIAAAQGDLKVVEALLKRNASPFANFEDEHLMIDYWAEFYIKHLNSALEKHGVNGKVLLTPYPERVLKSLYGKSGRLLHGGSRYMAICVYHIDKLMLNPNVAGKIQMWKGIIKFLLKRGVSPDAALDECCRLHNSDALKVLVESGVSPTRALEHWSRSLQNRWGGFSEDFFRFLIKKTYGQGNKVPGASPAEKQVKIFRMVKTDYRKAIYWLIDKGAVPSDDALSALPWNEPELLDLFLTITPNAGEANRMFQSYIPEARRYPQELFRILLKHGADPNQPATRGQCNGFSPIMIALNTNCFTLTEQLLVAGADVGKMEEKRGWKGVFLSSLISRYSKRVGSQYSNNLLRSIIVLALRAGAHVNGKNRRYSPLIAAIEANNLEAVKLLVEYGADPKTRVHNSKAGIDMSPMEIARNQKKTRILKFLSSHSDTWSLK